jgi:PAS domain S-box-containing protein
MRMPPGWDGLETAERIIAADPGVQIVICTAYSDHSWEEIRKRLKITDGLLILKKPFDVVEVLQIAHNLSRKWELARENRRAIVELDRRVEERTAEANAGRERFAAMFKSAPLAQFIIDPAGSVEVNEAACRLTGISQGEWKTPGSASAGTGLASLIIREHPLCDAEAVIRNASGEEKHVLVSSVVLGVAGTPALLLMMQDMTERRRLECDLRQMQKMDAVGQLAAGVAHDFNNLLTVIGGNARLMREALAGGRMIDEALVDEISEASTRAADMTRKLLAFTRRHVFLPVSLNLNALIENQVSILARLLGETVQVQWQPGETAPIMADAASLEQVILNLAVNARDAMPCGGHVTLSTGLATVPAGEEARRLGIPPGDYAWFRCTDNGAGMTPEVSERIFEPFFTTKETGKGTGLGLSSVYGTVKRHNGGIHLQTAPGEGTAIAVLLPLDKTPVDASAPASAPAAPEKVPAKSGLTVLMVEDEPAVRRIGIRLLASLGHQTI